MPDKFDPYREALVVEQDTVWPEEAAAWPLDAVGRQRVEAQLQSDPANAAHLDYVRLYTGFCRRLTVTPADVARVLGLAVGESPAGEADAEGSQLV